LVTRLAWAPVAASNRLAAIAVRVLRIKCSRYAMKEAA
jgi:hypothetical protein